MYIYKDGLKYIRNSRYTSIKGALIAMTILVCVLTVALISMKMIMIELMASYNSDIVELQETVKDQKIDIQQYRDYIQSIKAEDNNHGNDISNRGSDVREKSKILKVTAYDLSVESCGKKPSHPEYGITASGYEVQDWYTVAAGPSVPFGTKLYIPYFKDYPNKGIFVVQDRGSGILDGCLDIFIRSNKEAKKFGVKYLEVYTMEGDI